MTFPFVCLLLHRLEVVKHDIDIGKIERIGFGILHQITFQEHFFNLHIVNDTGITPRSLSKPAVGTPHARHAHATGKLSGAIGNELEILEAVRSGSLIFFESFS